MKDMRYKFKVKYEFDMLNSDFSYTQISLL